MLYKIDIPKKVEKLLRKHSSSCPFLVKLLTNYKITYKGFHDECFAGGGEGGVMYFQSNFF